MDGLTMRMRELEYSMKLLLLSLCFFVMLPLFSLSTLFVYSNGREQTHFELLLQSHTRLRFYFHTQNFFCFEKNLRVGVKTMMNFFKDEDGKKLHAKSLIAFERARKSFLVFKFRIYEEGCGLIFSED